MEQIETVATRQSKDEWLNALMDEFALPLTKLAYTYTSDWGKAQEIVQDVFVTCYNQYAKRASIQSYKAWIYRITINRAKDFKKTAWYKRIFLVDRWLEEKPATVQIEKHVIERDRDLLLSEAILALPEKYRNVIILYYYEQFSVKDIAGILNISENTVKTQLKRGRDKLKIILEEVL